MMGMLVAALLLAPRPPHGAPAQPQATPAPQTLSDVELREKVQGYLNALDRRISPEQWKALGPRAAPLLEAVVADPKEMPSRRAMAVDGLVAAAPDRAAQLVGNLARDENEALVVRVAAVHGAGHVLPQSAAVTELKPVLRGARQAGLRSAAAEVISRKGGCADVRDQVAREKPEHRGAFRRAMEKCSE